MALEKFDLVVTDIKVLPDIVVANNSHRYGNTSNVIYKVDVSAQGYKDRLSSTLKFSDVPIEYKSGNTGNNFIAFANLTPDVVSSWAANGLIHLNGANAIIDIQTELEQQIDAQIAIKNPPKPNLPWNK